MARPPAQLFQRQDEGDDSLFYTAPRLVTHIDDLTINALTHYYADVIDDGDRVLDLMSSWISHLPPDASYSRVTGLGMNAVELQANPRLDDYVVHNLNRDPTLPYPDNSYDAALIAVSVQYLVKPFEVFAEISRVLAPGGQVIVAMSHRCFPTKAIAAFHRLAPPERMQLVGAYMEQAGSFTEVEALDKSPAGADPLWIVRAQTPA